MKPLLLFRAIFYLVLATSSAAAVEVPIILFDDIGMSLPANTTIVGSDQPIDWKTTTSISQLFNSESKITLNLGDGTEIDIGIVEEASYVNNVNTMTRLTWLGFITQMYAAQIKNLRSKHPKGVASASGDRLGDRYRVMMNRATWFEGDEMHNYLIFDIFHKSKFIGMTLRWTADEGSAIESRIDTIISSIKIIDGATK